MALLFAVACCLPAFVDDEWGVFFGYECVIAYPLAMMHPAWYANVFLLAGMIVTAFGSDRKGVVVIAVLACGLALLFPPWSPGILIGYWVWLSAFVAFLAGSIAMERWV